MTGVDAVQGQAEQVVEGIDSFALTLLVVAVVASLAVLSNRISHRLIPAPAIFLVGAAAASDLYPLLSELPLEAVEQVVTVALILILFDGGTGIGVRKLRSALGPILLLGVVGTLLTAAAVAVLAHVLFGVAWPLALLLGTALAPTDPAVVFSVLGNREVRGRAGVIIEGESGANDPVGIALLLGLLGVGSQLDAGAIGGVDGVTDPTHGRAWDLPVAAIDRLQDLGHLARGPSAASCRTRAPAASADRTRRTHD